MYYVVYKLKLKKKRFENIIFFNILNKIHKIVIKWLLIQIEYLNIIKSCVTKRN